MHIFSSRSVTDRRFTRAKPLGLEILEDRLTPAGFFLTGVGGLTNPAQPNVRVYDASVAGDTSTILLPGDISAFPDGFAGSVRVANGDITGDGYADIITAEGPGAGSASMVRIFDGRSSLVNGLSIEIASFYAYSDVAGVSQNPGFAGGVFVACADFNGDGYDELAVSAGAGARGHLKVFNFNGGRAGFLGSAPELRSSFFAYTDFAGEIRITTLRAGGQAYLVTASGAGTTQCDVRLYSNVYNIGEIPDLTFVQPVSQGFPIPGYLGGLSVAAGDTDGSGNEQVFVSKNGGDSTVYVFDAGNLSVPRAQFEAFPGFGGEVRLGAADVDGDGLVEVLTSTGDSPGAGGAHVKAWSLVGAPHEIRSFFAYPGYINGVFLGTNDFTTKVTEVNSSPRAIPDTGVFVYSSVSVHTLPSDPSGLRAKSIRLDIVVSAPAGRARGRLDAQISTPGRAFVELIPDNAFGGYSIPIPDSPIDGVWTLALRDSTAGDQYRLERWTLHVTY